MAGASSVDSAQILDHCLDLTSFNTLALPARAERYLRVTEVAQLHEAASLAGRRFILGGGSNLVLAGDFAGLVLHMALCGRRLVGEDGDAWLVEGGAGENWHDFVMWTLEQGWPGLENLVLIPGTVGAAPIQNIGAYGLEVGERIARVVAYDFATECLVAFSPEDCRFAYRDSVFKQEGWHLSGRFAITAVHFRLPKGWRPNVRYGELAAELESRTTATPSPQDVARAVMAVRRRKLPDPAVLPNAGSFFHNPVVEAGFAADLGRRFPALPRYPQADGRVKLAAGWLIEQAGWKGRNLGPVGMYDKQALVLVNRGGARGSDVRALMHAVQWDVNERFGVDLVPEPVFLGEAPFPCG